MLRVGVDFGQCTIDQRPDLSLSGAAARGSYKVVRLGHSFFQKPHSCVFRNEMEKILANII